MSWNIDSISGRRHAGIGSEYLFVGSPSVECCNKYVEVALSSELEFKHQVDTARGEGGRRGRGGHESTEVPGCPEDRKRDGGRGGSGVVASRG